MPSVVLNVFTGCVAAFPLSQARIDRRLARAIYVLLLLGMFVPCAFVRGLLGGSSK